MQINEYKEVESTNSLVREMIKNGELTENTAILSGFQKKGRGQGSNMWFSDEGKNILASVFCKLDLPVKDFFMISMVTALSIHELMLEYGIETKLKWPNDIYFGDNKLGGILIENNISGTILLHTIIGMGININQDLFPDSIPNPTSMYRILNRELNPKEIFNRLLTLLEDNLKALSHEGHSLVEKYNQVLYRIGEWHEFKEGSNTYIGKINLVKRSGEMVVEDQLGNSKSYLFGDVEFVITSNSS